MEYLKIFLKSFLVACLWLLIFVFVTGTTNMMEWHPSTRALFLLSSFLTCLILWGWHEDE